MKDDTERARFADGLKDMQLRNVHDMRPEDVPAISVVWETAVIVVAEDGDLEEAIRVRKQVVALLDVSLAPSILLFDTMERIPRAVGSHFTLAMAKNSAVRTLYRAIGRLCQVRARAPQRRARRMKLVRQPGAASP
jgi:hypothetical protein